MLNLAERLLHDCRSGGVLSGKGLTNRGMRISSEKGTPWQLPKGNGPEGLGGPKPSASLAR